MRSARSRAEPARDRGLPETGSAVVDFVLVLVVLVPLFLGVLQVGLVLHVRNTLTSAASEGARYAAVVDRPLEAGVERTRQQIVGAVAGRFASHITATSVDVRGAPGVRVEVEAAVPPLGLWGPPVHLSVAGHAIEEVAP